MNWESCMQSARLGHHKAVEPQNDEQAQTHQIGAPVQWPWAKAQPWWRPLHKNAHKPVHTHGRGGYARGGEPWRGGYGQENTLATFIPRCSKRRWRRPGGWEEELQRTWGGSILNEATCLVIMANVGESSHKNGEVIGDPINHGKGRLVRGGRHDVDMWWN